MYFDRLIKEALINYGDNRGIEVKILEGPMTHLFRNELDIKDWEENVYKLQMKYKDKECICYYCWPPGHYRGHWLPPYPKIIPNHTDVYDDPFREQIDKAIEDYNLLNSVDKETKDSFGGLLDVL
jgi:hypothetical protein